MIPHWKRKFVLLWVGQAASILTSMISQYALIWYLTYSTGSSAVLSVATIAAMLPQGLLSPFTGAFADRFDRRIIMMAADGAIGLVSLGLVAAAADGYLTTAAILLALALRSAGSAFHTPCIQAVTPLLAPPEALARCAGWSQGIQTISMLLSPALAALLYEQAPLAWIIALDTLGAVFAISGVLLARLPVLRVGALGQKIRVWADTVDGFRLLRSKRWLWELCLICALFSLVFMPVSALYPLMSINYFQAGTQGAALVETIWSVGMLAGSVILGLWGGTRNKIHTMAGSILLLGITLVLTGLLPSGAFGAFVILTALMGLSAPFFNAVFTALIQEKVEGEYLGRVLGLTGAIMTLASPLGLAASAIFSGRTGLSVWFLIAGAGTLACSALTLALPSVRQCGLPSAPPPSKE